MKAGARKSLGEYKPLVIHSSGRTEVVGQRGTEELWVALTNGGSTYRARRGVTFATRKDAVAYAQKTIDRTNERIAKSKAAYSARHCAE